MALLGLLLLGVGYLENVEGSWPKKWSTWSYLMSWVIIFYPEEDGLFSADFFFISVSGISGQERGYLKGIEGS